MNAPDTETMRHILVVDDDERIRKLLKRYLASHGYRASAVGDAAEAERCMEGVRFDLLILDVMMPGETGLSLTKRLRSANGEESEIPILMLTARAETEQRIEGLESGASDYLSKPFEPRELLLRVRNLLRSRAMSSERFGQTVRSVAFGECRFEVKADALYHNDKRVALTGSEAVLLHAFASAPGRIFSRADISAWGEGEQERSIDVRINRLRRKIEPDARHPVYLQTIRGRGYVFRPDDVFYEDENAASG